MWTLLRLLERSVAFTALTVCAVAAHADCYDDAADFHHVNSLILRAISQVESGNLSPTITRKNTNGSIDYGKMQINSIHLPELAHYRMGTDDLLDACKSIYTGAWILHQKIEKYGNTWDAVGAYNSETPYYRKIYAAKVWSVLPRRW